MNAAHIHLMLNHLPIIGLPIAAVFLTHSLIKGNSSSQRFSLWLLLGVSLAILPVYFSGEPAEKLIEHLPGVFEGLIETHEEAAEVSLVLTILTGASALLSIWFQTDAKKARLTAVGTLIVSLLAIGSLGYTGFLGGKIRHTEIRDQGFNPLIENQAGQSKEKSESKEE